MLIYKAPGRLKAKSSGNVYELIILARAPLPLLCEDRLARARHRRCLAHQPLVPLSELLEGLPPKADRSTLTYVHCAAGVRVHRAAPTLEAMGFERVVPLSEGFATLAGLGFEYER